jgi:hypothetical protein
LRLGALQCAFCLARPCHNIAALFSSPRASYCWVQYLESACVTAGAGHLDRATSDSGVTLAVNIASLSSVRSPEGNRGEHTSLFRRALITFLSLIAIVIFLPFGIILSIMVKDTPLFNTLSRVFTSSRAAGDRGDPQSSKASKEQPRKEALIAQFRQITGAKSVPFFWWLFLRHLLDLLHTHA